MSNKYNLTDYNKARIACKIGYNREAEEVLRTCYNSHPNFFEGHLEYAKSLLFNKSRNKDEDILLMKDGFQILNRLINNPKIDYNTLFTAENTMMKALFESDNYYEAYKYCDKLLYTAHAQHCNFYMGCIDSRLGDVYGAEEKFKAVNGLFYDNINREMALITIASGDFDRAQNYIDKMKKAKRPNNNIPVEEIYLYIKKGDYKTAYELYKEFKSKLSYVSINYANIGYFLEYKLGLNDLKDIGKNYLMSQVVDYKQNKAKAYIRRITDIDSDAYLKSSDINFVNDIFNFAKDCIVDDIPFRSEILDYYVIECNYDGKPADIGFVRGNVPTNVIKVGAISGTKNIVTIRPIESLPYIRQKIEKDKGIGRERKK